MAQLPPQELEDLMLNGMLVIGGQDPPGGIRPEFIGVGAMPGQMPGEDILEEVDEGLEQFMNGPIAARVRAAEEEDMANRANAARIEADEEEDGNEDEEDEEEFAVSLSHDRDGICL